MGLCSLGQKLGTVSAGGDPTVWGGLLAQFLLSGQMEFLDLDLCSYLMILRPTRQECWKKCSIKKWIIQHCTAWHYTSYMCQIKVKWETVPQSHKPHEAGTDTRLLHHPKVWWPAPWKETGTALGALWKCKPAIELWVESLPPFSPGVKKVRVQFPHKKGQLAYFSFGRMDAFLPTGCFWRTLPSLPGVSSVWLCEGHMLLAPWSHCDTIYFHVTSIVR